MNKQMYLVIVFAVLAAATPTIVETMKLSRGGNSANIRAEKFLKKMDVEWENFRLKEENKFLTKQNTFFSLENSNLVQKIENSQECIQRFKEEVGSLEEKNRCLVNRNKILLGMNEALSKKNVNYWKENKKIEKLLKKENPQYGCSKSSKEDKDLQKGIDCSRENCNNDDHFGIRILRGVIKRSNRENSRLKNRIRELREKVDSDGWYIFKLKKYIFENGGRQNHHRPSKRRSDHRLDGNQSKRRNQKTYQHEKFLQIGK